MRSMRLRSRYMRPFPADFGLAIEFGRNAGTDAGLMQAGADDW